jgi:hypothetical protein
MPPSTPTGSVDREGSEGEDRRVRRTWAWLLLAFAGVACGSSTGDHVDGDASAEQDATGDVADAPLDMAPPYADTDAATDAGGGRDGSFTIPDATSDAWTRDQFLETVRSFCAEKARHRCAAMARARASFAPQDECRTVETARCVADAEGWQLKAWMHGRLSFNPAAIELCFAELDHPDWDPYMIEVFTACNRVWTGAVIVGSCFHHEECSSGYCGYAYSSLCGPTRCGNLPSLQLGHSPLGSRCWEGCELGTYCRGASGATLCDPAGDTTACTCAARVDEGGTCTATAMCRRGLGCIGGKCKHAAKGDACDPTVRCPDDLTCLAPTTGGQTVCSNRISDGEPCRGHVCRLTSTCVGDDPDYLGVCRPLPNLGEPCRDQFIECPDGAFCYEPTFTCLSRPRLGESCDGRANACYGGNLYCDPETLRCAPIPKVGEHCAGTCAGGSYCHPGTKVCRPGDKPTDEPCGGPGDCASGECRYRGPTCHANNCVAFCCAPTPELTSPSE